MTRVCPGETGNASRIANASAFEAIQQDGGSARNGDNYHECLIE